MSYLRQYPPKHMEALYNLEIASKEHSLAEHHLEKCFERSAYWAYLNGLLLEAPPLIIFDEETGKRSNVIEIPKSLLDFISQICNGKIETAIELLDRLTRQVGFTAGKPENDQMFRQLQMTGSFLRDVRTIIRREMKRPERYTHRKERTDRASSAQHTKDIISAYLDGAPNIASIANPIYATGPRSPSAFIAGYCLVCHRPSPNNNFYCKYHIKNKSERKKEQRRISSAFDNLDFRLPYENILESGTTSTVIKEQAFRDKCHTLEGWAKHRVENVELNTELELISEKYFDVDKPSDWPDNTVNYLNEIVRLTNKHKHTHGMFNLIFSNKNTLKELLDNLQSGFFAINDTKTLLTPITTMTIISRISQFRLIKLASSKKQLITFFSM